MRHTLNEPHPKASLNKRQQLHRLGRYMAYNVHALVAGKVDPRDLQLAFVAPISAIADGNRPRFSRQTCTDIRRHGIRLKRRTRLLRPKNKGARVRSIVMDLPQQIGVSGVELARHVNMPSGNLSKLRPTCIRKIGVADQNNVAIGAMCELKHVESNL